MKFDSNTTTKLPLTRTQNMQISIQLKSLASRENSPWKNLYIDYRRYLNDLVLLSFEKLAQVVELRYRKVESDFN